MLNPEREGGRERERGREAGRKGDGGREGRGGGHERERRWIISVCVYMLAPIDGD